VLNRCAKSARGPRSAGPPAVALGAALLGACAPRGPGELLLAPDPDAAGEVGDRGPFGAALWRARGLARAQEALPIDVIAPASGDGALDPAEAPYPALVLLQGGLVEVDGYHWLGAQLASRGYVVLAPHHPLQLALLEAGDAAAALRQAEAWSEGGGALAGALRPGAPAGVLGHSLGGVAAAAAWADRPQLAALVLLASFPAGDGPVAGAGGRPALSLRGLADEIADPAQVRAGLDRLPPGSALAEVEGLNHYGWVTPLSEEDRAREPEPPRPPSEARADARRPLDAYLDATLRGDDGAEALLDAGEFPGVTWSVR